MTREVSLLIVLALLGSITHGFLINDTRRRKNPKAKGTSELVRSLRKQLMVNNYDYMSMESEEPFPPRRELRESSPRPPPAPEPALADMFVAHTLAEPPRPRAAPAPAPGPADERRIHKNDLLYYVDNDRLNTNSIEMQRAFSFENNHLDKATSPKVKYKVLKVRMPGARRAGGGAVRRFVQVEGGHGGGGVALLALDGEPFPEFRVPRARRYVDAGGRLRTRDHDTDLELAPPSDLSGEMLTRPDNFY